MKVGTDGVLLGALADLNQIIGSWHDNAIGNRCVRVLDIGTGTGLIALMMAQRLNDIGIPDFGIDAVEIDHEAALQAEENFAASAWSKKMTVHEMPFEQFANNASDSDDAHQYDLIVSNPPFYNATLKPEDRSRAVARHKDSLPLSQIMHFAGTHLTQHGRIGLIYPTAYDQEVMFEASISGLMPRRRINILTKTGKPCKRVITEFSRISSQGESQTADVVNETVSLRNADGDYSDEYRNLTDDFYLYLR